MHLDRHGLSDSLHPSQFRKAEDVIFKYDLEDEEEESIVELDEEEGIAKETLTHLSNKHIHSVKDHESLASRASGTVVAGINSTRDRGTMPQSMQMTLKAVGNISNSHHPQH
jgi:CRISPR/Cas system-associated endonuclease Cas3-HD